MSLRILDAGLSTRVVDLGRPSTRHFGVPVGGAADRACYSLANALVSNPPGTAALEISLKGPIVRADRALTIAIAGAPFIVRCGSTEWTGSRSFQLDAGEEVYLGGSPSGMRAYLAVHGGFEIPPILGSRSGLRTVQAGEELRCRDSAIPVRMLPATCPFLQFPRERTLAVLSGPQHDWFAANELTRHHFMISTASDRMGLRLNGALLRPPDRELVSEPVCPGSIQVTREGQPIILGVDGQTIGGYPKIAQIIRAEIDTLGQLRAGDDVRFEYVELAEAGRRHRDRARLLHEWVTRVQLSLM